MRKAVDAAIDAEIPYSDAVSLGLGKGMETIGELFNKGKIFLPQVVTASKVMEEAIHLLHPLCTNDDKTYRGTVVMGSVYGDIHEIGKSVCCAMLRGAGFNVVDLGSDVSPEEFVKAAKIHKADVVGGSALMTTTLMSQKKLVETMKEFGSNAMIIFGGAPCTQEWVDKIGGDGYSASGSEIVGLVIRLTEGTP